MDFGMTHEQIKNFVVNSHVTDKRKLRQTLTEISTRNHERKKLFLKTIRIKHQKAQQEFRTPKQRNSYWIGKNS